MKVPQKCFYGSIEAVVKVKIARRLDISLNHSPAMRFINCPVLMTSMYSVSKRPRMFGILMNTNRISYGLYFARKRPTGFEILTDGK